MKTHTPHTPGPWTISVDGQRILGREMPDDQPVIATFYGAACDDQQGSANIARAVACVNACEGIADPGAVPELLAALRELMTGHSMSGQAMAEKAIARATGEKGVK